MQIVLTLADAQRFEQTAKARGWTLRRWWPLESYAELLVPDRDEADALDELGRHHVTPIDDRATSRLRAQRWQDR